MDGGGEDGREHCKPKRDFIVEGSWAPEVMSN